VLWRTVDDGATWKAAVPSGIEEQFPKQFALTHGSVFVRTQNGFWSSTGRRHWILVAGSSKPY